MIRTLLALCLLLSIAGTALAAVNANTATVEELQGITGIGPTIAKRIVDERRNGPYRSLADLQSRVRGIGETTIRKMGAAGLTVSGGGGSGTRGTATSGRSEVIEVSPAAARSQPVPPAAAGGASTARSGAPSRPVGVEPRPAGARP